MPTAPARRTSAEIWSTEPSGRQARSSVPSPIANRWVAWVWRPPHSAGTLASTSTPSPCSATVAVPARWPALAGRFVFLTGAGLGENARWLVQRHLAELERLKREILEVEKKLRQWADSDTIIQKLMTFRGVGLATATMLRAEIGEFDRFRTGKQLARYIGLTPRNVSSGERQAEASIIKAGNGDLRAMLMQLAHRLKRWDPRWRQLGEQLKKRGKPGPVVAAAVANRWVRWLHYELVKKPQQPAEPTGPSPVAA